MKKSYRYKRKFAVAATFLVLLLLFCVRVTGEHVHVLAGLVLAGGLFAHTAARYQRIPKCPAAWRVVDLVCMAAMAAVIVSGIALLLADSDIWASVVHKLSSVVLVVGILLHLLQHSGKRK